jgi:glucose/arabinose dehydrogenase
MKTLLVTRLFACLALAGMLAQSGLKAADKTAFELAKEGNKHVGEHAKDKIVQIRSEKSVGSVTPNVWYVVYYDQFATMKSVEVKFAGDKVASVKRPFRLIEAAADKDSQLNPKQLKVDSDKALKIALKEKILENLKVTASQMKLEEYEGTPVWKIRLWAQKIRQPNKEADIGQIFVAAEDGKVVRLDIKPEKVD